MVKPIILYGHNTGPNPWKVAMLLEELSLPYEHKLLEFPDMKKEPYITLNPNGRYAHPHLIAHYDKALLAVPTVMYHSE